MKKIVIFTLLSLFISVSLSAQIPEREDWNYGSKILKSLNSSQVIDENCWLNTSGKYIFGACEKPEMKYEAITFAKKNLVITYFWVNEKTFEIWCTPANLIKSDEIINHYSYNVTNTTKHWKKHWKKNIRIKKRKLSSFFHIYFYI